jgi:CxxC motif-containing protein (DUF1111 family)
MAGGLPRALIAALGLGAAACRPQPSAQAAPPGQPYPDLSPAEHQRFLAGRALFEHAFGPEEGLGPLFNQDRCSSCHDLPAIGGTGVETELKATRFAPPDTCDLLERQGGDVFQERATGALRARGVGYEVPPPQATDKARLIAPALFGLGLVEAIPDETILAREDPTDADGDGISGRAGRDAGGAVGRFGHKADRARLSDFIAGALRGEMGLTTSRYPVEERPGGAPLPAGTDPAPDPEITETQVALLADFVRFLAPPPAPVLASFAERDSVRKGRSVFGELGCPSCHTPTMRTGPSPTPALRNRTVALYSDLLLHDMGPSMRSVCAPGAGPSEIRTARLLGLRYRARFLHDGRAATLEDAILLHGGEAAKARDAFAALPYQAKRYLLEFLNTL